MAVSKRDRDVGQAFALQSVFWLRTCLNSRLTHLLFLRRYSKWERPDTDTSLCPLARKAPEHASDDVERLSGVH